MNRLCFAIVTTAAAVAVSLPSAASAERLADPLRFWEGRTESVGTLKIMMKKPLRTRSLGRGQIKPDGSLELVQRVEEDGKPPRERRWHIRKAGAGRFVGTMSEASGPVTIEEVGDRYRFRFKMKGNLAVEQWLSPSANGKSGRNTVTIKKLGVTVARSDGTVRKLD
jgi:hypothetical protein